MFWTIVATLLIGIISYMCYNPNHFGIAMIASLIGAFIINECYKEMLIVPIEEYRIVKVTKTCLTLPTGSTFWIEMKHIDLFLNKEFWHKIIKKESETTIKEILQNLKDGISPHCEKKEEILK